MAIRMKGEDRRAAIVDAAVHLFAEKGFRGTTTRELASALGVTEPVIYQHFETKNDLYSAILETKSREGQQRDAELAGLLESDDDRGFFRLLGNLILERYEDDPDFMRLLLFSALERHELADLFFERHIREFFQMIAGYIERRIEAGAFRAVEPRTAARGFAGMLSYEGLLRLLFGRRAGQLNQAQVVDDLVELFLQGIRRQ
jgi:AcrR family transcriptional regulator